jgi:hypothetical protein
VPDSPTRARFAALLTGVAAGVSVLSCGSPGALPPSSDGETPSPVTLPSFDDDYGLMLPAPPADRNLARHVQRRGSCANPRSPAFFFPVGTFRGPDQPRHYDVDASNRVGLSAILDAVREPSLSCRSLRSADFRFMWIRNMRQPLVVRVIIPDDRSLDAYVLIDAPGYDGGSLIERRQQPLRDSERRRLVASLESADFWRMPSAFDPPFPDAESFLVEARVASTYHVVGRNLEKPSPFRELGEIFIKIAGLPAPQD